jgi:hypothetical protein
MDPLSFTASIIAVATLGTQCVKAFKSLRNVCNVLPGRLHAVSNEVTDINAVLEDVAALLAERGRHSVPHDEQANISHVVARLTIKLTELKSIVEALTASCARSKIPIVKARAWSKVQGKLFELQEEIKIAKTRLNVLLGTSNSYVLDPTSL